MYTPSLRRLLLATLIAALLLSGMWTAETAQAQDERPADLIALSVSAGYDSVFRPNQWLPIRVQISNQGEPIAGRLVVRPETSGSGVTGTFSTPVDLPANASQTFFLYITARSNARDIRVELLNDRGGVMTSQETTIVSLAPRDSLHVVVSDLPDNAPDLSLLGVGGYQTLQVNWRAEEIPDRAPALDSVNVMVFANTNSASLSTAQQAAVRAWVRAGGHLIVIGGANWQPTAAGLVDLLPLLPESAQVIGDVTPLARLAGVFNVELAGDTIATTGALTDGAQVLAAADDVPLLARQRLSGGTVDYLTVDPTSQPLRDWVDQPELWLALASSVEAQPSWTFGFSDWLDAITAVSILPGLDILPAALGLVVFLAAYIALIGPVNYWVLNRINRREYAWFTIPALILIFSGLAWSVGFELRGNQATLSRMSVVQTWPDSDEAHLQQVLGLLVPRRGDYTLSLTDDRMLRPVTEGLSTRSTTVSTRPQSNVNIQQSSRFEALDFPVDASFIASFHTQGVIPRPDVSGRVTLTHLGSGEVRVQGSVRNDSDLLLDDAVIVGRGATLRLPNGLAPGAVVTFGGDDLILPGDIRMAPTPLEYARGEPDPLFSRSLTFRRRTSITNIESNRSVHDVMGGDYQRTGFRITADDDPRTQELRRRQAFVSAFMLDQFASTARGNRVFLMGWTDTAPVIDEVQGVGYETIDSTLYIVELTVESARPSSPVTITADQFTWISRERDNVEDLGPTELFLTTDGSVTFRFTPVDGARLARVDELVIIIDRARTTGVSGAIAVWDWFDESWEVFQMGIETEIVIDDPARFIGPQNSVQVRTAETVTGSSVAIRQLGIQQRGVF